MKDLLVLFVLLFFVVGFVLLCCYIASKFGIVIGVVFGGLVLAFLLFVVDKNLSNTHGDM